MRYLHRHPSEIDLTIDQIAEVAVIGEQIERQQAATAESLLGGIG